MQTRLFLWQDEIWLKTNNIMEESSELINFTTDNNIRSRIILQIRSVLVNSLFESIRLVSKAFKLSTKFEYFKELFLLSELFLLLNAAFQVLHKLWQIRQSFLREILRRRCILLNTLEMFDG